METKTVIFSIYENANEALERTKEGPIGGRFPPSDDLYQDLSYSTLALGTLWIFISQSMISRRSLVPDPEGMNEALVGRRLRTDNTQWSVMVIGHGCYYLLLSSASVWANVPDPGQKHQGFIPTWANKYTK